jgi:hypothetical protein
MLNKEVCRQCQKKNEKRNRSLRLYFDLEKDFDEDWEKGTVWCTRWEVHIAFKHLEKKGHTKADESVRQVYLSMLNKCPYLLEHTVSC